MAGFGTALAARASCRFGNGGLVIPRLQLLPSSVKRRLTPCKFVKISATLTDSFESFCQCAALRLLVVFSSLQQYVFHRVGPYGLKVGIGLTLGVQGCAS